MLDTISRMIRDRRKALGFTIEELAEKSGSSYSFISRIERGEVDNLKLKKLNDIVNALGLKMSDLFVDPDLTGVQTLELMHYLAKLPNDKREEVASTLLKVINL
ncbi:transcriptional regulator [Companilactobacillus sp. RD055328]|uniref:helix-turn-helix domain-containing protein n=1 Tax=Companilactobacillus sp. RD055328 TaxID=2916634 RepID=UPI001FC840D3|nr:helix-turn-helix transcriptional regulator [Companilactobacillus sp. RD055328]GKQ42221.1 transcriptional regulator [Companilactobacillus sp. RD055328]